jgi:Protein of unknown function (DUF1592)/Protein of unknown function (DUF1588)/Protein of unknown function (DUF1585)/Protein of unknown function (DUF1587)/Protein of unknown function (DUF1595)
MEASLPRAIVSIACCAVVQIWALPSKLPADEMPATISAVIKAHCLDCHQGPQASAALDLASLNWNPQDLANRNRWIQVHDRVAKSEMPPEDRLPQSVHDSLLQDLRPRISQPLLEEQRSQGRTGLRRLNRREFENSLHDLLGIQVPLQHLLPQDARSQGFDTVSAGLRFSAMQVEKYFEAIDVALDATFRLTSEPKRLKRRFSLKDEKEFRENLDKPEFEPDPINGNKHRLLFHEQEDAVVFISNSYSPDGLRQFAPPADGRYRIRISAYAVRTGVEPVAMRVYVSDYKTNRLVGYYEMLTDSPRVIELELPLTVRDHLRVNGYNIGVDQQGKNVWTVDSVKGWNVPGLAVQWIEVEGPLYDQWPPPSVQDLVGAGNIRKLPRPGNWTEQGHLEYEVFASDPAAFAKTTIESFAVRAFRRPLQDGEVQPFVDLALNQLQAGANLERAIRVSIRAILTAPQFLFLEESPGPLDDYALASRLSYFLWSSMPDQELLQKAAEKQLSQPAELQGQVERLLASPKSQAFMQGFVTQWLDLDQIDATAPDMRLYPEYDELLRSSMVQETQLFVGELIAKDLSISNIVDSNFLMLDRRLSVHYQLPIPASSIEQGLFGEQFRRVELTEPHSRGGLMTQASVLKVTANGTVTSPVRRGSWILRQLLGEPPAPPPPVPAIEPDTRGSTTIREQLDKHRNSATCNRCHRSIDPPGFALESFDVIGGYRDRYRSIDKGDPIQSKWQGRDIWEYKAGLPVDCKGTTADGLPFSDVREFKQLLLQDQQQLTSSLTSHLVTYATGAGVSFADRSEVDRITKATTQLGGGLRTLIQQVVASELFRHK